MNEYKYCVSLRITHPKIDPDKITNTLGIKPDFKWKFGEPRRTPRGIALAGKNTESYWTANLHSEPNLYSADITLEEFISKANIRLSQYKEYFANLLSEGGRLEYFSDGLAHQI